MLWQEGNTGCSERLLLALWMFRNIRSRSDIPYTFLRLNPNIITTSSMKRMLHIILNGLWCLIFYVCHSGMLIDKEKECGKKSWFANVFATLELTIHRLHLWVPASSCPWRFPLNVRRFACSVTTPVSNSPSVYKDPSHWTIVAYCEHAHSHS